jgi:hypothetical protein
MRVDCTGRPERQANLGLQLAAKNNVTTPTPGVFCAKSSQSIENKGRTLQKVFKSSETAENNADNGKSTEKWF